MYMMKNSKHSPIDKWNAFKCFITITWKWFIAHWLWLDCDGRTAATKLVWSASNSTQSIQIRGGWKPGYHWQVRWALWNRKLWWRGIEWGLRWFQLRIWCLLIRQSQCQLTVTAALILICKKYPSDFLSVKTETLCILRKTTLGFSKVTLRWTYDLLYIDILISLCATRTFILISLCATRTFIFGYRFSTCSIILITFSVWLRTYNRTRMVMVMVYCFIWLSQQAEAS